jgi:Co/Zn/Cd efflux system component
MSAGLRRVIRLVAILNLAYFGIEFAVALAIGSVSLFADSIDFLEDASVNFLILVAMGWNAAPPCASRNGACRSPARAGVSHSLDCLAQVPHTCAARPPTTVTRRCGCARGESVVCAHADPLSTHHAGSLTRAAFLSARNDALANVAIIGAGLVTIYVRSAWPDLIVGLGIAVMNADAAREVYRTARAEHRTAVP